MSGSYHERYLRLVSREIDGELDPEGRARLQEHLADCAACRQAAEQLRLLSRTMRTLGDAGVGDAKAGEIAGRQPWTRGSRLLEAPIARGVPVRWLRRLSAAAAVLVIAFGVLAWGGFWHLPRIDAAPAGQAGERVLTVLLLEDDQGRAIDQATDGFLREIRPGTAFAVRAGDRPVDGSADLPPSGLDPHAGDGR